ncbi:MAG: glycine--tRNA ligase subunit beta [Candidatus Cloacimonetes bacterium HGW-Cloacimonetes-1]|nr:MAG: glycine--tRNA ligase subunit beta [Candidatus Cloacimonetes bacterium HGW-Cloacimonetes-1]
MDKRDFLIEIGVEELPAEHIAPAIDFMYQSFKQLLQDSRLDCLSIKQASTPRRIALLALGVDVYQADIEIQKSGPARKICYDDSGKMTPAALGFLKKNNASAEDAYIESTEKGEFIALKYTQKGLATAEILQNWATGMISQIPCAKRMIWKTQQLSFSRPIRWILALWDTDVLPIAFDGIQSGNISYGHRLRGMYKTIEIKQAAAYFDVLAAEWVIADRDARRQVIQTQLSDILPQGFSVVPDEKLLSTVCDMVEYPTAVLAHFEEFYLKLPAKIITSTISQNQKYFSVEGPEGKLSNIFVFISNGDPRYSDVIRSGNEKVVKPRLADALWYFDEDTKYPLDHYLPKLSEVVFHSKLGTVADKSKRVERITGYICQSLDFDAQATAQALRTAQLAKADLVTLMLGEKEFTKLQGYIGKQYATAGGETQEVADGIYEHYMPRGQNDELPSSVCGAVVAVADKMDTVCGIIGIGLMPTGSADPYALRRAANGIVQIIADRKWNIDLIQLIQYCLDQIDVVDASDAKLQNSLIGFFRQRIVWLLKQQDLSYDVIDSVMCIDPRSIVELQNRASALQQIRSEADFVKLVIGFKRVSNIIAAVTEHSNPNPELFELAEEGALLVALQTLHQAIDVEFVRHNYPGILLHLVAMGANIDAFFDAVLVNCENEDLRRNRYALLSMVRAEFLRFADLSLIVVEND